MTYSPPIDHPVYFGGVAVNTDGWDGVSVHGIRVQMIEGWIGTGPEIRDARERNPGRDGERPGTSLKGGRTVTMSGIATGASYAELQEHLDALNAIFAQSNDEQLLKIPRPDEVSPSWVYASSMPGFERVSGRVVEGVAPGGRVGRHGIEWQVSVRASDPLIYSDVETTVGGAATTATVASYGGRAPTPARITVTSTSLTDDIVVSQDDVQAFAADVKDALHGSTVPSLVMDASSCDAYIAMPHHRYRIESLQPLAYWPLNETSGTVADNAMGSAALDGTRGASGFGAASGGPVAESGYTNPTGIAASGHVTIPAASLPLVGTNDWTIEGWVVATGIGGYAAAIATGNNGFGIQVTPTSCVVDYGIGTRSRRFGYATIGAGWHHVALEYQAGSLRFYVDGVLVARHRASDYVAPSAATSLWLGRTSGNYFNGQLSSWSVSSRAVGAAAIETLASFTPTVPARSGVARRLSTPSSWPHIDGATTFRTRQTPAGGGTIAVTYREART